MGLKSCELLNYQSQIYFFCVQFDTSFYMFAFASGNAAPMFSATFWTRLPIMGL